MSFGMEHPVGEDIRLRCPLFLFDQETVEELEPLIRDLRGGGYTFLPLRELFRCRRGLRSWPPRPCAILLRDVSFAVLQTLLPLLEQWETPVGLFCRTPYGGKENEELRTCRWMQFYGDADPSEGLDSLLPEVKDLHIAAFCETPNARAAGFLRENHIWMAVTSSPVAGSMPGGVDLLYALPVLQGNRLPELLARWHRALTAEPGAQEIGMRLEEPGSPSVFLPVASHLPVTDPTIAAYLCILGDTSSRMEQVLASTDWNPVFDPLDGSYRMCPSWNALTEQPLKEVTPGALLRAMEEGGYPFLPSRGLLLFGYDGERDVFLGMAARDPGVYGRVDLRPRTLEDYRADYWTRLTPDRTVLSVSAEEAKAWADGAQCEPSAQISGWSASVAFANRVSGGEAVSAASLRTFLEERMLCAFRLRFVCEQENLYAEQADRYLAMLEQEGRPVLRVLQERGENSLPRMGNLLQRLLNAEWVCRLSLSEGLARMQALRTFRTEKQKKE